MPKPQRRQNVCLPQVEKNFEELFLKEFNRTSKLRKVFVIKEILDKARFIVETETVMFKFKNVLLKLNQFFWRTKFSSSPTLANICFGLVFHSCSPTLLKLTTSSVTFLLSGVDKYSVRMFTIHFGPSQVPDNLLKPPRSHLRLKKLTEGSQDDH